MCKPASSVRLVVHRLGFPVNNAHTLVVFYVKAERFANPLPRITYPDAAAGDDLCSSNGLGTSFNPEIRGRGQMLLVKALGDVQRLAQLGGAIAELVVFERLAPCFPALAAESPHCIEPLQRLQRADQHGRPVALARQVQTEVKAVDLVDVQSAWAHEHRGVAEAPPAAAGV